KATLVQDAIFEAIRAKIAEHKPVPDFPALVRQANYGNQPGNQSNWGRGQYANSGAAPSPFQRPTIATPTTDARQTYNVEPPMPQISQDGPAGQPSSNFQQSQPSFDPQI